MNSLQAGLIGISVLVIALLAAWMWWQSWRSKREDERRRDVVAHSAPAKETSPSIESMYRAPIAAPASLRSETRVEPSIAAPATTSTQPDELRQPTEAFVERNERAAFEPPHNVASDEHRATPSPEPAVFVARDAVEPIAPTPADAGNLSPRTVSPPSALPLDERLHVFALITAHDGQAIDCPEFASLADRSLAWGRVFRLSAWESIDDLANGGAVQALCLSIPIASRAGPLGDLDALEWKREVSRICDAFSLDVSFGGDIGVGARAQELDQFLAAADVICVLYLVRKDGAHWSGTRLRGTLEANGFRLQADGRFVYFEVESETPIFSAVDGFERSFTPERLRTENVNALRLVFEASNVAQPTARFDVYRQTLRALARLLEADIKDSSGAIVGDDAFMALRNDVQAGSQALADAGIECGSSTAQALFR
jgi:ZipA, C-terminal FtsZ-binding domain